MLTDYSWTWGLLWSVVDRARVAPLKKTAFPWSSSDQFWIASWPGVGCGHFPAPCWDFICLGLAQVFCMLPQSLRLHVCISPVLSAELSLWSRPPPPVLTIVLLSLPHRSLRPEDTSVTQMSRLWMSTPKSVFTLFFYASPYCFFISLSPLVTFSCVFLN